MSATMTYEELLQLPPEKVPRGSALRGDGRIIGPKWPITLVAMVAALVAILDVSIVNVALPSIRASLGATLEETSWIATAYMVSNIIVIPMTGFFQRRIGYRAYFAGSLILFTFASVMCAFSWNLWSLVAFRMLQGLGGGAIMPTSSSIMLDRFPKSERTMAMAMFGMGAMSGPLLGPWLGGWLTDAFSWHMIFLINLPVGIVAVALILAVLREDRSEIKDEPIDYAGIGFLAGWLGTMQYVLEEGQSEGWFDSPLITVLSIVSFTFFLLFIDRELSTPYPLVKLKYFADRQYATGTIINMGLGVTLFGGVYLFSLFTGVVMNYRASDTGNLIFWAALAQGLMMPLIGRFGGRFDGRYLVGFGFAMMVMSLYQYTLLTGQESQAQLLVPQMMRSVGMVFVFIPMSTLALDGIPAQEAGDATGLFSLTRELGGSMGTAFLSAMITRRTIYHAEYLGESVSTLNPVAVNSLNAYSARFSNVFGDPTRGLADAYLAMHGAIQKQALVWAFNDAFAFTTAGGILLLFVVMTMRKPTGPARGLADAGH